MSVALHHGLLGLTTLLLGDAAVRTASLLVPSGLLRVTCAAVLAGAVTVMATLALGTVGLGGDPVATTAVTVAWFTASRVRLPAPGIGLGRDVAGWWHGLSGPERAAAGALAGGALVWCAWLLRHPAIGFDGSIYHFAEVANWVNDGHPGRILSLGYDLPYGNYPLTEEVRLTWFAGLARSWVPFGLWAPSMLLLAGVAARAALHDLDVPRLPARLAVAAIVSLPLSVRALAEVSTDVPALAWLLCTGALCAGAARRPALLAPAIVGAGLAIGTKTSVAVPLAACLVGGLLAARRAPGPRADARMLGGATALAVGVGGIWMLRNLFDHGSPLWPFVSLPFGDARPGFLTLVDARLLAGPHAAITAHTDEYLARVGGGALLVAVAVLIALVVVPRRRDAPRPAVALAATATAVLAMLAWAVAPGTGLPTAPGLFEPTGWPLSTLRYALPAFSTGAIALALLAKDRGGPGRVAVAALAVAVGWNVVEDARLGLPFTPTLRTFLVGAVAGIALAWAADRLPAFPRRGRPALAAATAIGAGLALSLAATGYVERHAGIAQSRSLGRPLVAWFTTQPGFKDGDDPIAFASRALVAPLAGDRLRHPLRLVGRFEPCDRVLARARAGWVVVSPTSYLSGFVGIEPYDTPRCFRGLRPRYDDGQFAVYRSG